jgi:sterol desaturase/sphingolipid hydroxylase (fatty acid hydroxylase superfamily)
MTILVPAPTPAMTAPDMARALRSSFVVLAVATLVPAAAWWIIVGRLLPDQMSVSAFGHATVLKHINRKGTSDTLLTLALVAGIFFAEMLSVGWKDCSWRRIFWRPNKSTWSDITTFISNQSALVQWLSILLSGGLVLLSTAWFRTEFVKITGVSAGLYQLPLAIELIACYLVYTFLDYWTHRIAHLKWFWPLHRFHHAAEDFCIVTAVRVHPGDIIGLFVTTIPLTLLGPSDAALLAMSFAVPHVRLFIHSRIRSELGIVGRTLLQAPAHHRLHHVLDISEHPVVNFSLFPLWDRMFGTWRPINHTDFAIGVDTPYRHGAWFLADLWRDYCDYLGELKGLVLGWFGVTRKSTPGDDLAPV